MRKTMLAAALILIFLAGCAGTDTVAIRTIPDGVKVYPEGVFACDSPCDLPLKYSGVSGEKFKITLEKQGFVPMTFEMNRPQLADKFFAGDYIAGSKYGAGNTFVFTYNLAKDPAAAPPPVETPVQQPTAVSASIGFLPATTGGNGNFRSVRRVALVIGNSHYPSSPLPNPVNDARDVTAALRGVGFDVMLLEDAGLRQMEDAINRFSIAARDAVALFFYAGHGLQVDGENYLVPIGARLESEGDVRYEAVAAGRVLENLRYAEASLNIVILDACRTNPFARSFRKPLRGLARMDAPRGSIIAYSTAPGEVASDGSGRNSPYAAAFLRHVASPGIPVESFFKEVAKDVSRETGDKQRPWISSDFLGEFSFSR